MFKTLFLIATLSLSLFAVEANPLPKTVDPILSELTQAKVDAIDKAIKKLQKIQVDVTKKGDLEGATAVKAKIDELNKEANALIGDKISDAQPDKISGKWNVTYSNGHVEVINIDNSLNVIVESSTWDTTDFKLISKDNKYMVTRKGSTQVYSFDKNSNLVMIHGGGVTATLVKAK